MDNLLHSGKLYDPNDELIAKKQRECMELLYDYNATRPSEGEKRNLYQKVYFLVQTLYPIT